MSDNPAFGTGSLSLSLSHTHTHTLQREVEKESYLEFVIKFTEWLKWYFYFNDLSLNFDKFHWSV